MIFYGAAVALAVVYAVVAVLRPRWALEVPIGASDSWARENAVLHVASVAGLVVTAFAVDLVPPRIAVLAGGCVAVCIAVGVDIVRWSKAGLTFDAAMLALIFAAAHAEAG